MKIKDQKALYDHRMQIYFSSTLHGDLDGGEFNKMRWSAIGRVVCQQISIFLPHLRRTCQKKRCFYRYLSQPAVSLGVDFPKHLADCTRIYFRFAHRLAPQKLLLRLTKGAWSIHLERVSVGVCLSGMKLRVYCDSACSFAPGAFTLYETSVT